MPPNITVITMAMTIPIGNPPDGAGAGAGVIVGDGRAVAEGMGTGVRVGVGKTFSVTTGIGVAVGIGATDETEVGVEVTVAFGTDVASGTATDTGISVKTVKSLISLLTRTPYDPEFG